MRIEGFHQVNKKNQKVYKIYQSSKSSLQLRFRSILSLLLLSLLIASSLKHTNAMHSVHKKVTKRIINAVPEVTLKNKVKKVDTIEKLKKSATKAELLLHIECLEQKYNSLEKEHKKVLISSKFWR